MIQLKLHTIIREVQNKKISKIKWGLTAQRIRFQKEKKEQKKT